MLGTNPARALRISLDKMRRSRRWKRKKDELDEVISGYRNVTTNCLILVAMFFLIVANGEATLKISTTNRIQVSKALNCLLSFTCFLNCYLPSCGRLLLFFTCSFDVIFQMREDFCYLWLVSYKVEFMMLLSIVINIIIQHQIST